MSSTNLFRLLVCSLALLLLAGCGSSSSSSSNCGEVTEISPNGILGGSLSGSDCEVQDLFPGSGDNSLADEYRVTVIVPVTMTITLRSTEIDSFLWILNTDSSCAGGCNPSVILTVDDDSGGGLDSQIVIFLNPGSYIIVANSFSRQTGAYTLETSAI